MTKYGQRKFVRKPKKKFEECDDFEILAETVGERLGDKEWAKLLEQKAKELEEDEDGD